MLSLGASLECPTVVSSINPWVILLDLPLDTPAPTAGPPTRRSSGQHKWVSRADNMISHPFEGAESMAGLGLPQLQRCRGFPG